MIELTLEKLIEHLGEPVRQRGAEYEWQCPFCQDWHEDNLKFNENKGVLYCFANPEHSKTIIREICKKNKTFYRSNKSTDKYSDLSDFAIEEQEKETIFKPSKEVDFYFYMLDQNSELFYRKEYLEFLLKKRGINEKTVDAVNLGIDLRGNRWVIPTIKYNTVINDFADDVSIFTSYQAPCSFEYRPLDLSKNGIRREKDCPTCLAQINEYTENTKILAVVEGYFDGYALFQYLTEIGQIHLYHIVTPSNGINGLLKQIDSVDFEKYKRFELFIDNDEPADRVAEQILEKYPFFNRVKLTCGCKDFNEHYMKCIKG